MADVTPEILIVDDDLHFRKAKAAVLRGEGFRVRLAADGRSALVAIADRLPDLVLLDVDMPKLGGFAVCEEIRKVAPLLPIVFFTAYDSEQNQVRGFGIGGDDYLAKSVPLPILLASIRRALARSAAIRAASQAARRVRLGGVEVDFDALTARGDGVDEKLTKTEADFLGLLASEPGRVFTYDEIFAALRGRDHVGDEHALQVHANNLRRKLGRAGDLVRNDRGLGYSLVRRGVCARGHSA